MGKKTTSTYTNTRTRSVYDLKLDELKGKILFKKKLDRAEKTFSETVFPQEVIDLMTRKTNK